MRRRRAHALFVAAAVAIAACSGGASASPVTTPGGGTSVVAPTNPPSAGATATPQPTAARVRFDDRVTLPDGGWLKVKCSGTASPTILLEAGGTEGNISQWGTEFPATLARDATVCRYSRRGGEGSSEAPDPLTWASMAGDADALLAALKEQAGIVGPYVFVGWSFGGEVALGEAIAHRPDTKGLVILDTDFPHDFMAHCQASGHSLAECQAEFDQDRVALSIEHDLIKTFIPMPEIPIVLVSALRPGEDCIVTPGATLSADIGGDMITASDCETLFAKIADKALADWGTIGPVQQTRVDADHDGLIRAEGRQIAELIRQLIAGFGAS